MWSLQCAIYLPGSVGPNPAGTRPLDDILITAGSREDHLKKLDEVLSRLEKYGVRVKWAKCKFMESRVEYLGHMVDSEGLHPTNKKVVAILYPSPTNESELCSFIGLLNDYGRFLKNLSTLLQPLYALLQKESSWWWTAECESVHKVKETFARKQSSCALRHQASEASLRCITLRCGSCNTAHHGKWRRKAHLRQSVIMLK